MEKSGNTTIGKLLTANDLRSGGVVFATAHGGWSPFISQALLPKNSEMSDELELFGQQSVDRQLVVEPFFIDIVFKNGAPCPVRLREQLRVNGPSVQSAFAKPVFREVA